MRLAFRKNTGWLMVACLCSWVGGQERNPTPSRPRAKVVGYLTEDGIESGRYTVKDVATRGAAGTLTQIDYAFGRIAHERCEIMNRKAALERSYSAAESVSGQADPPTPARATAARSGDPAPTPARATAAQSGDPAPTPARATAAQSGDPAPTPARATAAQSGDPAPTPARAT